MSTGKPMCYKYAVVTADDGAFIAGYDGRIAIYRDGASAGQFLANHRGDTKLTVRRILVENPCKSRRVSR
jgi:hypothetical protein